jgi:alkylation response protein AidB-like acyl-CoA dehydrogenase
MSGIARSEAALRRRVESWAADRFGGAPGRDSESAVRHLVRKMAEAGLLDFDFGPPQARRRAGGIDLGTACVVREVLARRSCFADQVFMDQAWASLAVSWFGGMSLRDRVQRLVTQGKWLPGIVLPPPADRLGCRLDGGDLVVEGMTDWVANAGVANVHIVFAPMETGPDDTLTAMVIDADIEGVTVLERVCAIGAIPMARLAFKGSRVPLGRLLGRVGAASEILRACHRAMEPSRDASRLGLAQREIDRHARMRVANDAERLRSHLQAETGRLCRSARRLTIDRALRPGRMAVPSNAALLLQHTRTHLASIHLRRES